MQSILPNQEDTRERVELFFKAFNLSNKDGLFGTSDPQIRLYEKPTKNSSYQHVGSTEVIVNSLNPSFQKSIDLYFVFEKHQYLKLEVIDSDGKRFDRLGHVEFELGEVMGTGPKGLSRNLISGRGTVTITFQKTGDSKMEYFFQMNGRKVKNVEWFSKSDPFLKFYRPVQSSAASEPLSVPSHQWIMVYESEFHKDNLNPKFRPFTISSSRLCYGDANCPIKVEIWDNSKRGHHRIISTGYFRIGQLLRRELSTIETYDHKPKFAGYLDIQQFNCRRIYSLAEYLRGGLQLSLYAAIDFTGSNGAAHSSNSLHYLNPNGMNQYQAALSAVGSILEMYDSDKQIPVYGYGARCPALNIHTTSHCFPLTGDPSQPFVEGVQGMFNVYQSVLPSIVMSGPTNFCPVIQQASQAVSQGVQNGVFAYSILLILTDGLISDEYNTINAIVEASYLPLSIIIVGVGNEDFSRMEFLDSDEKALRGANGKTAVRDIVQFVPFRRFRQNFAGLAEAVLKESLNRSVGILR